MPTRRGRPRSSTTRRSEPGAPCPHRVAADTLCDLRRPEIWTPCRGCVRRIREQGACAAGRRLFIVSLATGPVWWPWRLGDEVGWAIVLDLPPAARRAGRADRRSARPERRGAAQAAQSARRAGRDRCLGLRELRRGLCVLQRAGGCATRWRCRSAGILGAAVADRRADVGRARRHGNGVAAADGRRDQLHRRGADLAGAGARAQSLRLPGDLAVAGGIDRRTAICAISWCRRRSSSRAQASS